MPPLIVSIGHEQLYFFIWHVYGDQKPLQKLIEQLFLDVDCVNKPDEVCPESFPFHQRLEAFSVMLSSRNEEWEPGEDKTCDLDSRHVERGYAGKALS
jgi:hypothetical protein